MSHRELLGAAYVILGPKGSQKVSRYTSPDFSSTALITIDMQQDTLDGQPLEVPGTSAILPTLKQILQSFRDAGGKCPEM